MDIPADEYRVRQPGRGDGIEDALSGDGIAVPTVGPACRLASLTLLTQLRDQLALRQYVPCGIGLFETVEQPLLLLDPEQGALCVEQIRAGLRRKMASAPGRYLTWLLGAVLAAVEKRERRQVTKAES